MSGPRLVWSSHSTIGIAAKYSVPWQELPMKFFDQIQQDYFRNYTQKCNEKYLYFQLFIKNRKQCIFFLNSFIQMIFENEKNLHMASSYRPISLLPSLLTYFWKTIIARFSITNNFFRIIKFGHQQHPSMP